MRRSRDQKVTKLRPQARARFDGCSSTRRRSPLREPRAEGSYPPKSIPCERDPDQLANAEYRGWPRKVELLPPPTTPQSEIASCSSLWRRIVDRRYFLIANPARAACAESATWGSTAPHRNDAIQASIDAVVTVVPSDRWIVVPEVVVMFTRLRAVVRPRLFTI